MIELTDGCNFRCPHCYVDKSKYNRLTLEDIKRILGKKGSVLVFEKSHQFFNAGKTSLNDHKELIFIAKVGK